MNTLLKKNGIIFGIVLGILLIIPSIIGYFINIDFLLSNITFIGVFASVIVLGIICISVAKKKLSGNITFKESFGTYFIMLLISLFISTCFNFVLFNVIDNEFHVQLNKKRVENIKIQLQDIKNNPETSKETIATYEKRSLDTINHIKNENSYSISSLSKGFTIFLAIFSIFGVLLCMILRNK